MQGRQLLLDTLLLPLALGGRDDSQHGDDGGLEGQRQGEGQDVRGDELAEEQDGLRTERRTSPSTTAK